MNQGSGFRVEVSGTNSRTMATDLDEALPEPIEGFALLTSHPFMGDVFCDDLCSTMREDSGFGQRSSDLEGYGGYVSDGIDTRKSGRKLVPIH